MINSHCSKIKTVTDKTSIKTFLYIVNACTSKCGFHQVIETARWLTRQLLLIFCEVRYKYRCPNGLPGPSPLRPITISDKSDQTRFGYGSFRVDPRATDEAQARSIRLFIVLGGLNQHLLNQQDTYVFFVFYTL
jgi:hypothetical protein